ncbi:hypothetical protein FOL47_000265 [Perkinsus chesapeaki]|uniref:Hexose transporter 1 n=1 Tax=Perkinsus chesapeaki TaxID=330153 RepID=A0A7J6MM67_PERCH|nr:hypothetical protein FOL47_000265 [Perkinsus chesapeaki]
MSSLNLPRPTGTLFAVICACSAMLGPLSGGVSIGFTGSTIDTMRNSVLAPDGSHIDIGSESNLYVLKSTTASSLFSAALTLGALIGTLSGGPVAEATGRRLALLIAAPLSVLGYLGIGFGSSPYLLIASRFVNGLSLGLCAFVTPVYMREIVPATLQGPIGTYTQTMLAVGIFLAYAFGWSARTNAGSLHPLVTSTTFCNWRLVSFICIIPPTLLILTMLFAVESPSWLATRGRIDEARTIITRIRSNPDDVVNDTLALENHRSGGAVGFLSRVKILLSYRRQIIIAVGLNAMTQLSGVNAMVFFQTTIFLMAGVKNADVQALAVQLGTIISNLLTSCVINRVGRRLLLVSSAAGMCLNLFLIATTFLVNRVAGTNIAWMAAVASYCYQITYAWGVGPIRWMVAAELFPDEARGLASSLAASANWFFAFLTVVVLETAIKETSPQTVFYFFACVAGVMTAFAWYLIPETRGKTTEEIQVSSKR